MSAQPYLNNEGTYLGIDVMKKDIEFCSNHYPKKYSRFLHHDIYNRTYSPSQSNKFVPWNIKDNSTDLLTALSVWTHLQKEDSIFYLNEVNRILKPGSRAIITFFLKDEYYNESLLQTKNESNWHNTEPQRWIFDKDIESNWYTTSWTKNPEDAIALDKTKLGELLKETEMEIIKHYPGTWKEIPGLYFQDILIMQKAGSSNLNHG